MVRVTSSPWAKQGHRDIVETFVQPARETSAAGFFMQMSCHQLDGASRYTTRLAPPAEPSAGLRVVSA